MTLSIMTRKIDMLPYPFEWVAHNLIRCLVCGEEHYASDMFHHRGERNLIRSTHGYDFTKGLVHANEMEKHGHEMNCPSCASRPEVNLGRRIRNFLASEAQGAGA